MWKKCRNICYIKYNDKSICSEGERKKTPNRWSWGFCLLWRETGRGPAVGTGGGRRNNTWRQRRRLPGRLAQPSPAWHIRAPSPESRQPARKETSCQSHSTLFFLVFLIVFSISFFLLIRKVWSDWWPKKKKKKPHAHCQVSLLPFILMCSHAVWDEETWV